MSVTPEEGLRLVEPPGSDLDDDSRDAGMAGADPDLDGQPDVAVPADGDLEALRDEFVEAYNARDLDVLLSLAAEDVECPDIHGDGIQALADELAAIWERSPAAILTRGFLDGEPCAVGWLPDEEGCWSRAALVTFASEQGLLSVVSLPDDVDSMERAEAEDPSGEEQDEGTDWSEWDSGEARSPQDRERARP